MVGRSHREYHRVMQPRLLATMVTTASYGSWLPGDMRGYVENGIVLPGDPAKLARAVRRMASNEMGLIRFMRSWSRDTRAFRRSKDGFSEAWLWRPQGGGLERACELSLADPRAGGAPSARLFLVGLLPSRARLRFTGQPDRKPLANHKQCLRTPEPCLQPPAGNGICPIAIKPSPNITTPSTPI